jgi:XTP/dITP diphosphohydrolase
MTSLIFATGNINKFLVAKLVCNENGVDLLQKNLNIDEIQSENPEKIIIDKLNKAYKLCNSSVLVSDDYWDIPGLNGFPGPYMKSINKWFTPEDFLRLTLPLKDRRVFLIQRIAYRDSTNQKVFDVKTEGEIQKGIRGHKSTANQKIMSMSGDNGLTISEVYDKFTDEERMKRDTAKIWREFLNWHKTKPT